MARRASGLPPPSGNEGEVDYLDRAIKFKERIVASNVINSAAKLSSAEAAAGAAPPAPAQSPFQVSGKVNLGEFNFQEAAQAANKQLQELVAQQQEELKKSGQLNLELRDKIQEKQNEILKLTFGAQIDALNAALQAGSEKKGITDQIKEAREVAELLGMQLAGKADGTTSPELSIKLKEMEFQHLEYMEKLKDDRDERDRNWQIQLRDMDDKREQMKADIARQSQRDQFFSQFPQLFGAAVAQGILDRGGSGTPGAQGIPATGGVGAQPTKQPPAAKAAAKPKQPYHFEMLPNESGEFDCPECGEPVALGPTARSAVCPGCGTRYPIKRVEQAAQQEGAPQAAPPAAAAPPEEPQE